MSDGKIRGRPPGSAPTAETPPSPAEKKRSGAASPAGTEPAPADMFEHSAAVGAKLQDRLSPLAKRTQAGKIHFTNKDIEQLANTFASIIADNPQADRLRRAQKFAAAVLRQKKLKKLFEGLSEHETEKMCDTIGEVLNDSPVFGQMVDNVTEGAGKLSRS